MEITLSNTSNDISTFDQLQRVVEDFYLLLEKRTFSMVFLTGDLGSGKTTFVQMLLKHIGYDGHVPSPSYSLVNTYSVGKIQVAHADFYRLDIDESLSLIGWDIVLDSANIVLVEWPEILDDKPDFHLKFRLDDQSRFIEVGS